MSVALTLDGLRRAMAARLRAAGLPTPDLDARWLLAEAAALPERDMLLRGGEAAGSDTVARMDGLIARRLAGEPVDRILGVREFWGLSFRLSPATLSPRPDTETVVRAALDALPGDKAGPRLLDLGTGSGAILAALLAERPEAFGVGLDASAEAARMARENLDAAGFGGRFSVLVGDWAKAFALGCFDLVVSNPPYIPSGDLAGLSHEVREHDPALALDGGPDGLAAYRHLAAAAPVLLAPGGALVLELGIGQEAAVAALLAAAGLAVPGAARRDLAGIPRALTAFRPPAA